MRRYSSAGTDRPFIPAAFSANFVLRTATGVEYLFDTTTGSLTAIRDDAGHRITVSTENTGPDESTTTIASSEGDQSITITRAGGRITAIQDPAGNSIVYDYGTYDQTGGQASTSDNLGRVTDRTGKRVRYEYLDGDFPHNLTAIYDSAGVRVLEAVYDASSTSKDGVVYPGGHLTALRDAASQETGLTSLSLAGGQTLSTVTDAQGMKVEEVRDSLGRVLRRIQALDPEHPTPSILDADRRYLVTVYRYNLAGLITAESLPFVITGMDNRLSDAPPEPADAPSSWAHQTQYDSQGRVLRSQDALGAVTTYTYDSAGRVLTTTDPLGNVTHYVYDGEGELLETYRTQGVNGTTKYQHTRNEYQSGQLVATYQVPQSGPEVLVSSTAYDTDGRMVSSTDAAGVTTYYAYDYNGNQTEIWHNWTDPDGLTNAVVVATVTIYDDNDRATATSDYRITLGSVDDLVTSSTDLDTLLETATPTSATATHYDNRGQVEEMVNRPGIQTWSVHDARGKILETRQQACSTGSPVIDGWLITRTLYDAQGRVEFTTDPYFVLAADYPVGAGLASSGTRNVYDNLGRIVRTERYNGIAIQITISGDGVGEASLPTGFDWDDDNTWNVEAAKVWQTETACDDLGNVTSTVDESGNETNYYYDQYNRLDHESDPLGQTTTYAYNALGQLTVKTDRDGRHIAYGYDVLGRETLENWYGATGVTYTLTYAYDEFDKLTTVTDSNATYTFAYDTQGRQISVTVAIAGLTPTVVLTDTYDAMGNRNSLSAEIGQTDDFTTSYVYDALNQMVSIWQSGTGVADKRADFGYNNIGQLSMITRYADLVGTELVATSDYTYDVLSRLTGLTHRQGTKTLAGYTWSYDSLGHLVQAVSSVDGTADYSYDGTGQFIGADYDFQTAEGFSYDASGNRAGYTTGTDNRLLSDGNYTYQYDSEGNRIRRTNIATGAVTEYTWDYRNRLTDVNERASLGGAATKHVHYTYDYQNRLISRTIDPDGDGPLPAARTFSLYDGQQVALELGPSGIVERRVLSGSAVDQVLAEEDAASRVDWLLPDHEGTIRDVAEHNSTTHDTTVVDHLIYGAFGNITGQSNAANQPENTYIGRPWDADAGLYYCRARWYDANIGRFVSEDPLGFTAGDTNVQRYVKNNPLTHTDPYGLMDGLGDAMEMEAEEDAAAGQAYTNATAEINQLVSESEGMLEEAEGMADGTAEMVDRMATVRQLGQAGEDAAEIVKNTEHIASLTRTAGYRIPDVLNRAQGIIGEVKNVARLFLTRQLQDFLLYAEAETLKFVLIVRLTTELSPALLALRDAGKIVLIRKL